MLCMYMHSTPCVSDIFNAYTKRWSGCAALKQLIYCSNHFTDNPLCYYTREGQAVKRYPRLYFVGNNAVDKRPVHPAPQIHAVLLQLSVKPSIRDCQTCQSRGGLLGGSDGRQATADHPHSCKLRSGKLKGKIRSNIIIHFLQPAKTSFSGAHLQGDQQVIAAERPQRPSVLAVPRKHPAVARGSAAIALQLGSQEPQPVLNVLLRR